MLGGGSGPPDPCHRLLRHCFNRFEILGDTCHPSISVQLSMWIHKYPTVFARTEIFSVSISVSEPPYSTLYSLYQVSCIYTVILYYLLFYIIIIIFILFSVFLELNLNILFWELHDHVILLSVLLEILMAVKERGGWGCRY